MSQLINSFSGDTTDFHFSCGEGKQKKILQMFCPRLQKRQNLPSILSKIAG